MEIKLFPRLGPRVDNAKDRTSAASSRFSSNTSSGSISTWGRPQPPRPRAARRSRRRAARCPARSRRTPRRWRSPAAGRSVSIWSIHKWPRSATRSTSNGFSPTPRPITWAASCFPSSSHVQPRPGRGQARKTNRAGFRSAALPHRGPRHADYGHRAQRPSARAGRTIEV